MKYKVTDYYLALLSQICYGDNSSFPKIPADLVRFIFSFIGPKQIMNYLNGESLITLYDETTSIINNFPVKEEIISFHPFINLPYPNIITIHEIINIFTKLSKKNKQKISFSHICCNGKGCVFNIKKKF